MTENVVYKTTLTRKIYCSDKIITSKKYFRIRYGIPLEKDYKIDNWGDLLRDREYIDSFEGYEDRKGRLYCDVLYGIGSYNTIDYTNKRGIDLFPERVYKDRFEYMDAIYFHEIIDIKNVRMKDLFDELSVEEFILFLKDHEIDYLPHLK